MKREPLYTPTGDGAFTMGLAGALLLCGDMVYGNPAETPPTGISNARTLMDRILAAATEHGFKMTDTLHALLRRNERSQRLANLARDAVWFIPRPLQAEIVEQLVRAKLRDG